MANDNTVLDAKVKISIDNSTIDKSISNASKKLEAGLAKADVKLSKQLTKQIDRDINRLGKSLERSSEKASKVLEKGLKIGLGAGASALYAFLKSGTPEALRFSVALDKVKVAWMKVGQTLATKINFRGKNLTEWVEVIADKIANLDTSQIEKMVGYFKLMAAAWATIKIAQGLNILYQFGSNIMSAAQAIKGLSALQAGQTGLSALQQAGFATAAGGAGVLTGSKLTSYNASKAIWTGKDSSSNGFLRGYAGGETQLSKGFDLNKSFNLINQGVGSRLNKIYLGAMSNLGVRAAGRAVPGIGAILGMRADSKAGTPAYESAGKTLTGFGGAALGLKIGAAIGTAIAPGLGTAIGGLIGSIAGYITGTAAWKAVFPQALDVGQNLTPYERMQRDAGLQVDAEKRQQLLNRNIRVGGPEGLLSQGKMLENLFGRNINAGKTSADLFKGYQQESRSFVGGAIPVNIEKDYVKYINRSIKEHEGNLKLMSETWNELSDLEKAGNTTLKEQMSSIEGELEKLYSAKDGILGRLKTYLEKIDKAAMDYLDQDIGIEESRQTIKDKLNEELTKSIQGIDEQIASNMLDYDMYAQKALEQQPTATQTSVSMGQDISSIPGIISSALNDSQNQQAQKQLEIMQREIDLEEKYGEMMSKQFEFDQEKERIKEEHNKRMETFVKPISEVLKRIETNLTGSSTVTWIGGNTATA